MWEHDYIVNGYSKDGNTLRLWTNAGVMTCWDYLAECVYLVLKDKEQTVGTVNGVTISRLRYDHRIHLKYNSEGKVEVTYNGIC